MAIVSENSRLSSDMIVLQWVEVFGSATVSVDLAIEHYLAYQQRDSGCARRALSDRDGRGTAECSELWLTCRGL